jgi:hypothetical protein
LPPDLRAAAFGEALLACGSGESDAFVPELLELAILPAFEEGDGAVRRWSQLWRETVGKSAAVARADEALGHIARAWENLSPAMRRTALGVGESRWHTVAPALAADARPLVRRSIARLAGDAGDARLADLAAALLFDTDPAVSELADRALVMLTLASLQNDAASGVPQSIDASAPTLNEPIEALGRGLCLGLLGTREELVTAVARGAAGFDTHRRRGVVLAAMLLLDRRTLRSRDVADSALSAWFMSASEDCRHAVRAVLRSAKPSGLRVRAIEWLGMDPMSGACAQRLSRAVGEVEYELVLGAAHLLEHPRRHRNAGSVVLKLEGPAAAGNSPAPAKARRVPSDGPVPGAGVFTGLTAGARRMLPRFVGAIRADVVTRRVALEPLLSDDNAVVRFAAISVTSPAGLADLSFDADERVARSALIAWSGAGDPSPTRDSRPELRRTRLLQVMTRSPHESVRAFAEVDLANASDPWADTPAGRLAARRWMVRDNDAFMREVRARLRDPATSVGALGMIRKISATHLFAAEIVAVLDLHRREVRPVATAVAAAGDLLTPDAATGVRGLLDHEDARVRANAVESIARQARAAELAGSAGSPLLGVPPAGPLLVELKADPHHRVRVNALRAMLAGVGGDSPDVHAETLIEVLTDDRPMHRLAGVWLASRTLAGVGRRMIGERWPELVARVGEAARFDDDPRVRRRAAVCAARVDGMLRTAWRGPSGGVR